MSAPALIVLDVCSIYKPFIGSIHGMSKIFDRACVSEFIRSDVTKQLKLYCYTTFKLTLDSVYYSYRKSVDTI